MNPMQSIIAGYSLDYKFTDKHNLIPEYLQETQLEKKLLILEEFDIVFKNFSKTKNWLSASREIYLKINRPINDPDIDTLESFRIELVDTIKRFNHCDLNHFINAVKSGSIITIQTVLYKILISTYENSET